LGKIGWIIYTVVTIGLFFIAFVEGSEWSGITILIGFVLGILFGAFSPWDEFGES
jgi:membrane-associated PAP2 superfamily phosphatase